MFLCQKFDSRERSLLTHVLPVPVEFCFMAACHFLMRSLAVRDSISPSSSFPSKSNVALLSLVLRMEVRRVMIPVEQANYYTKEYAYGRHIQRVREVLGVNSWSKTLL